MNTGNTKNKIGMKEKSSKNLFYFAVLIPVLALFFCFNTLPQIKDF